MPEIQNRCVVESCNKRRLRDGVYCAEHKDYRPLTQDERYWQDKRACAPTVCLGQRFCVVCTSTFNSFGSDLEVCSEMCKGIRERLDGVIPFPWYMEAPYKDGAVPHPLRDEWRRINEATKAKSDA